MAPICRFGPLTLDLKRGTLVREGRPIALGAKGLSWAYDEAGALGAEPEGFERPAENREAS